MSEESQYDSHPISVSGHYSTHVPQTNGCIVQPGQAQQIPGRQSYRYRAEGAEYSYNMNGVAGGPQPNHSHQAFPYNAAMPSVPRGPPTAHQQAWPQFYDTTPEAEQAHRGQSRGTAQPSPTTYPPSDMPSAWNKAPTSFVRSQHSQGQIYSHSHNMGGHTQNYNIHPQSYNRPLHNPLEPCAAPSPPNPYPGSPRTPISAHQIVSTNGMPTPQPFRQSNQPRVSLSVSAGTPDNSVYRPEPAPSHASTYADSGQSSPSTHSLPARQQGRNSVVSPLGPPVNTPSNYVENSNHRSYNVARRTSYGQLPPEEDGKRAERPDSLPKSTHSHYSQFDSDDERQVKREMNSRSPTVSMSPRTSRTDRPRSPSFAELGSKGSKAGLELQGKKKGLPVFRGSDGVNYYENEPVPPGIDVPSGWQIGTGKQTKGLLLPKIKDGISVNPEWGFTAGGKARQRLPQACRNCRSKKIRCVESDYDELVCQHCMKMRITCQRYEKEDDRKKKHRGSQSQEYIKMESEDHLEPIASDAGASMNAPNRTVPRKRKSTDENINGGSKRLNRGTGSRAGSIASEPLTTTLDIASPTIQHPPVQTLPTIEKLPLFPSDTADATAMKNQGDSRGNQVKALRENQLMVSQSQEIHGQGRTNSMPDASPYSYPSSSPTNSISRGPNGFIEPHGYPLAEPQHRRAMRSSTPATLMDTPPMIPQPIGEDSRHNDLPGPQKLEHFVEAYFDNVYSQTYAFLHRPSFMKNMHSHPPVLLFSMCAVSARFSEFPDQEVYFADRARQLIMENYDNIKLEVVQSMVHMGLHDFGSNNGHKAWMFAGMAVRMGAALNMNLENRKKVGGRDAITRECARRTYWSYYLMDRFNSYGVARPFLTQDHDCHIQLPCNQPSFMRGKYVKTEHLLGPNPYHLDSGTKYMGAMAYLVRVVGIWGNILKQIHLSGFQRHCPGKGKSSTGAGSEFNGFIEKLENWRKTLPPGLEYSNENLAGQIKVGTTGAFVMMHVMWHTAMAYVHRYVRTVGVPKDYIQENIPSNTIVESIRKAFVHADAVLQIMSHVQQKKNDAKFRGEPPITVNAPFLGQAISDACNITVIRALEVRGEAAKQKERVSVGVEWLKELKRYWKPIEGMYKRLKKTCRSLDRRLSQPPSAHMVPTPESSIDSGLQPGTHYTVDPADYTAEPTFTSGADISQPLDAGNFAQFTDFLTMGNLPTHFFNEAFSADMSQFALSEYARHEGGFPDLYPYSEPPLSSVSAPYEYDVGASTSLGAGQISEPMQVDQSTASMPEGGSFIIEIVEQPEGETSDDDDDPNVSKEGNDELNQYTQHAIYFDPTAVRDGNVQDSSSSDASGHSRRASEAATMRNDNNPMDVLNLINKDGIDLATRLQTHHNEPDEFTGPGGRAAPGDTTMGGRPNLDNSCGQN